MRPKTRFVKIQIDMAIISYEILGVGSHEFESVFSNVTGSIVASSTKKLFVMVTWTIALLDLCPKSMLKKNFDRIFSYQKIQKVFG